MPLASGQESLHLRVVVIGGAGFIGSHLVDALVERGHQVRIVDSLDPQVHPTGLPPSFLNPAAEFVHQDILDIDGLARALEDANAVYHLAGAVGVGDSMYRIRHYTEVNLEGSSNLLEILANSRHAVRKVILASSVTVYGEGKYSCPRHGVAFPSLRLPEQVARREWELTCPERDGGVPCALPLEPLPTDEGKPLAPQSIYAITKRAQEELFLAVGRSYGIPATVLRYFNVVGPRQAISNPYTGVAKNFALEMAAGNAPVIYEDGRQTRDFIHVSDVNQANLLALANPEADGQIFNVGTGCPTTISELAHTLSTRLGRKIPLEPSGKYRIGDVRHCFADISKAQQLLGFAPRVLFPEGLDNLLPDRLSAGVGVSAKAHAELQDRGLIR
ncbi:MAG TPA: NAD-dependent epimerase/dehydratase family protein [Terriglobia bacterium]|nr:NAD-dependent epimerase/dehydratase family protein [Terriglobia bacterium]